MSTLRRTLALLVCVACVFLAGCGDTDAPRDGSGVARGGEAYLPGPVPDGVHYKHADASAPDAPSFHGVLLDGTPVRGRELWSERPVVLFFLSSWCRPCAERQQAHQAALERFGDRVAVLGIAGSDSETDVRTYLRTHEVDYPVVVDDGTIWRAYAIREPPAAVFIGKGGHLVRGWPGGADDEELTAAIKAQLRPAAGQP